MTILTMTTTTTTTTFYRLHNRFLTHYILILFGTFMSCYAPFFTELFNRSMSSATVPDVFKSAFITPLFKKPDLSSDDPHSY